MSRLQKTLTLDWLSNRIQSRISYGLNCWNCISICAPAAHPVTLETKLGGDVLLLADGGATEPASDNDGACAWLWTLLIAHSSFGLPLSRHEVRGLVSGLATAVALLPFQLCERQIDLVFVVFFLVFVLVSVRRIVLLSTGLVWHCVKLVAAQHII